MFAKTFFNPATAAYYDPETDHKVAVVTGGTQGIGFFTILHLYLHGFTVYLLGRNEEKCTKAIASIQATATTRQGDHKVGAINYIHCDLLSLKTVKDAADALKAKEKSVDVLINNAGLMAVPYDVSEDGIEVQYQVNCTAHALLTLELIPLLQAASAPRVVFVTSLVHQVVLSYKNPSKKVAGTPDMYYSFQRYGLAKLGQIHFVKQISKLFPQILFVAVHPGVIHTELYSSFYSSLSWLSVIAKPIYKAGTFFMSVSEEDGSLASLRAALDSSIAAEKDNGKYFVTGGVESTPSKLARKEELIKETWNWNLDQLTEKGYSFEYATKA